MTSPFIEPGVTGEGKWSWVTSRKQNRVLRVLKNGENLLSYFLNQLWSPERIILVVVDGANVPEIERYIFLIGLGTDEDNRLVESMSKTKFIKHVGIASRKLC